MSHPSTPSNAHSSPELRVIRPLELASHARRANAGVSRLEGITHELVGADQLWVGMTVLEPGRGTGPHHHGALETGMYVVSGRVRLRWGSRLESETEMEVGDLIFVPPMMPHQEINCSTDEPAIWMVVWGGRREIVRLGPDESGVYSVGQDCD